MAKKADISSTKKFGARYGRKVKYRFGIIEAEQRKLHKCPYCNAVKVKRVAAGIWACRRCGVKFTGKAYSVKKEISFKKEEEQPEISEEEKTEEELKENNEAEN